MGNIAWSNEIALDLKEARDAVRQAVEWARRSDDPGELITALLRWGWTEYMGGNYGAAEERFSRARSRAIEAGDEYRALVAERDLAWVEVGRGDYDRAAELFEEVLSVSREAGYRTIEARSVNGLGEVARFEGDIEGARRWYRQFGRISRELHRPSNVALARVNLAQVELMAERFEKADEHIREARRRYKELSRESRWIHQLTLLPMTHAAGIGDWSRFDELFETYADGWPEDERVVKDYPWLLEMAGEYAAEDGRADRADAVWRLAGELWTELGDQEAADRLRAKSNG